MALNKNIELEQGATFEHEFEWLDIATGLPIDLTGWTAEMQIRPDHESAPLAGCDLKSSSGEIVISESLGLAKATILPVITAALIKQNAVYDFKFIRTSDGFIKRHSEGYMLITPQVTRPVV